MLQSPSMIAVIGAGVAGLTAAYFLRRLGHEVDRQLAEQKRVNQTLMVRNFALKAEVRDLKEGLDAVEERARNELGMIRQDEVFFQILDGAAPSGAAP